MKNILILVLLGMTLWACQESDKPLPILGNHDVDPQTGDTIYHTIPDFTFIDQDSQVVTNQTFAGKAYVADFFFTSCPTICPKVAQQMLRLEDRYAEDDGLMLLSHTIDVKHDTIAKLKKYQVGLGANPEKWKFVTGEKAEIYNIANDYMSIAIEDPRAPGGFDHSGWLILVDENRHIRAFANGTDPESVDEFMLDIDKLLAEGKPQTE